MERPSVEAVDAAHQAFKSAIRNTPLVRSTNLETRIKSKFPIYLKAESLQHTGSFKVRGALNKLLSIEKVAKEKGVVTASAGNHAQGVAFFSKQLGIKATIVMPVRSPLVKVNSTRALGAEVVLQGESYQEAFDAAKEIQAKTGAEYVHAFDDPKVIEGQATLGKEIYEACPDIEVLVSPVGGGGLLAGAGSYLKEKNGKIRLYAVQAAGCSTFIPSLEAGKPVRIENADTIAEGMSAKQLGNSTFSILKEIVDEARVVSDEEISEGILWALENERLFVEGCGGAAIGLAFKEPSLVTGPTVLLLSGGNLDVTLLGRIIDRGLVKSGRLIRFEVTISDVPGALESLLKVIAEEGGSIRQIDHERVFASTSLKEVIAFFQVETTGNNHASRIKSRILEGSWKVRFI